MSEEYRVIEVRGEPLPAGRVGACVRVRLTGCPSSRWGRDLTSRLVNEILGHAAIGHLRLDQIIQGDQIVLEGVEAREASALALALNSALEETNRAFAAERIAAIEPNMPQVEADAIAEQIAREAELRPEVHVRALG
jgi:hypothetical protein